MTGFAFCKLDGRRHRRLATKEERETRDMKNLRIETMDRDWEYAVRTTSEALKHCPFPLLLPVLLSKPSAYHSTSHSPIGNEDFRQQRCLTTSSRVAKKEAV